MDKILAFVEKHKGFFKKLILFIIYVIVVCCISSDPVTQFFTKIFGEYITAGIQVASPFLLVCSEV